MRTSFLKKLAIELEKKQDSLFAYPIEKQKKYVAHFPEPKDGIERGYYQYCCQMKLYGAPMHFLVNVSAFPLSLYYILKYKKESLPLDESVVNAVFFNEGKPFNIIPNTVVEQYKNIVTVSSEKNYISKDDMKFLRKVFKRYPFSWMLWLKLILKLSQYSHAIAKYSPKAIICCSEFSFTSPIMTEYCHSRGVKLINVMHGEKLYFMRDAFAKYDEYYVWDQFYMDLLQSLRADSKQFKIALPTSLVISETELVNKLNDYTYYLASETEEILQKIAANMGTLKSKGFVISIRPHPRYSDMNLLLKYFSEFTIENTNDVNIELSLKQTRAAISLYSTVLNQAYHSGVTVIVDDISNKDSYEKLKELEYIMINTEHKKLSQIME